MGTFHFPHVYLAYSRDLLVNELCVCEGVFVCDLEKKCENPTNRRTTISTLI